MMSTNFRALVGIACISLPLSLYGQEIGTLFTTAEERAYLDYLRQDFLERNAESGFDIDQNAVPDIPTDEEVVQEEVEFYFSGIATSLDGGRSVWLNGESIIEGDLPDNATITELDGVAALRLVGSGGSFVLKPGQTVNISTGEFWEAYQRRPNQSSAEDELLESADEGLSEQATDEAEDFFSAVSDVLPDAPEEIELSTEPSQTAP